MKKFILSFFFLSIGCMLTNATMHSGTFKPLITAGKAGQILTFTYNPDGSDLQAEKPIQASLYEYIRYKWIKRDIALSRTGSEWKGHYNIPSGSAFLALKFYQGTEMAPDVADNNNNNGFTVTPLNSQKKKNPGAAIASVMLTMPRLGFGLLNYVPDFNHTVPNDQLQAALDEEFKIPESDVKNYLEAYISIQRELKGSAFNIEMTTWINNFLQRKDLSESNLVEAQRLLKYSLKDNVKADSLSKMIVQKYPTGSYARLDAYSSCMKENKTRESVIRGYEGFLQKFPYAEWLKRPNEQEFIYYESYRVLSSMYFDTKNFKAFLGLFPQLNFKTLNEIYRWNIERAYMFKTMSKDSIYNVAEPLMTEIIKKVKDESMASNGFYSKEQSLRNAQSELEKRLMIHIALLTDLGKNKEALSYLSYYNEDTKFSDPDLNDTHLRILENMHADQLKIRTFMENCVFYNAISPSMYDKLKLSYVSSHGNSSKFDDYISSLKSSTMKEKLRQQIEKNLMYASIPEFDLEDLKGNLIHSSDWKNRIVVIDFWATWCRPCIRALPGMQIVVDKYVNNPSVAFYFVGTMQTENYKQKTEWFIKKEGFRLNFVYDCVNQATGEQNAAFSKFAKLFNSSGIPRKVIIKNGILRYTTEGYSGSATELSDELSAVIDLLQLEK